MNIHEILGCLHIKEQIHIENIANKRITMVISGKKITDRLTVYFVRCLYECVLIHMHTLFICTNAIHMHTHYSNIHTIHMHKLFICMHTIHKYALFICTLTLFISTYYSYACIIHMQYSIHMHISTIHMRTYTIHMHTIHMHTHYIYIHYSYAHIHTLFICTHIIHMHIYY